MKQLQPDLWQCAAFHSGILNTHAYFLQRKDGNILFYNTSNSEDLDKIVDLGGVKYQMLSHRDESAPSLMEIKKMFDCKLCCSSLEEPHITKDARVDITFDQTNKCLSDIDIIHTPGHTDGSICYFYKSPHGKSYLFTGDTFYQSNGQWATYVREVAGGDSIELLQSLVLLRDLEPDIVMCSAFVGSVSNVSVTVDEWTSAIDKHIALLR